MRALIAGLLALTLISQAQASCSEAGYANATASAELEQGPYHLDEVYFRSNVTDEMTGIPIKLQVTVLNLNCEPIPDAIVEIWHANATGYYSGEVGANPGGGLPTTGEENANTTFGRGFVQADANGLAEFYTVFPGCYSGLSMHIHYGVHIVSNNTGTEADDLASSHLSHIGRMYFEDALVAEIEASEPYVNHGTLQITTLEEDRTAPDDRNVIATVTYNDPNDLQQGATVAIEATVNPMTVEEFQESGSTSSMGGGMGGGGMGPMPSGGMGGGGMGPSMGGAMGGAPTADVITVAG